jgi:hypothetical protein
VALQYIRVWVLLLALICSALPATASTNRAPAAHAGADQTALPGATVILDGSASTDTDGDSLTYSWSLRDAPTGTAVQITNASSVRPSVVLPVPGIYSFQLIVTDGSVSSQPDSVTITTFNSAPVANAGIDQSVPVGGRVVLDGSGSTDVDGDALTYEWSLIERPDNSSASLLNADPARPTADFVVDEAGRYIAHLTVRDANSTSGADATIVSTGDSMPKADAGHDRAASVGERVEISGGNSTDADGDALSYRWSLIKPTGSVATLSSTTAATTSFAPDVPGTYVVQLIVNDGNRDSAPETVAVSTENARPIASAIPERSAVYVGETLYLLGYYSYDPDGDPLTYSWSVINVPPGSAATLPPLSTPVLPISPDLPGTYVVQLIVNDGLLDSEPSTLEFEASLRPPPEEPIITVDDLPQSVNVTPYRLTGSVSEPASLWINGELVPLDSNNRFDYLWYLVDGGNTLDMYAQDEAGNQGYYWRVIWLDTQAPAPPDAAYIHAQPQPGGRLIVRGQPGAVESGTFVHITNVRTGETVQVQASSDGNFIAELAGIESDDLSIVAEDEAHNISTPIALPGVGSGPLRIEIVAPLSGTTIASNTVLVKGELFGPVDAGVAVNGRPAIVLESGRTRSFAALVALLPGGNTIAIVAARPNGITETAQLQVTSDSNPAFMVTATPSHGGARLDVMFHISEYTEQQIARTEIDLNSDGDIDIVRENDDRYIPASYLSSGYYEATVKITTSSNQVETTVIPISVQTPEQVDAQIQRVWSAIISALRAGDGPAALTHFTADAVERYRPAFERMGSNLPTLADALTEISVAKIHARFVECLLIRNVAGNGEAFLVSFTRSGDGVWRLASF